MIGSRALIATGFREEVLRLCSGFAGYEAHLTTTIDTEIKAKQNKIISMRMSKTIQGNYFHFYWLGRKTSCFGSNNDPRASINTKKYLSKRKKESKKHSLGELKFHSSFHTTIRYPDEPMEPNNPPDPPKEKNYPTEPMEPNLTPPPPGKN